MSQINVYIRKKRLELSFSETCVLMVESLSRFPLRLRPGTGIRKLQRFYDERIVVDIFSISNLIL